MTDSIWGDGIKLLVENNSAKDYTRGCDALIVNDYMITDLFSADVAEYVDRIIVMNSGEVMFDGVPKAVFSHYKELEAVGLAAPPVTYLMHDLVEKGIPCLLYTSRCV